MRVLALVPYPINRAPGQRFRLEQWAPFLSQRGIEVTFSSFLTDAAMSMVYEKGRYGSKLAALVRGYWKRISDLRTSGGFDAVIVHRWATFFGPAWCEPLLARRVPLVFDFDDAIFLPQPSRAAPWARVFKPRAKTAHICRVARHVVVGNTHLADYARRHNPAVTIVPTTIDTDAYRPVQRGPNPRPVVGWSGSLTTLPHLQTIAGALEKLARRVDCELRVIGGQLAAPGLAPVCSPWRADTEVEDIGRFDVGLMPLPDDEWSRGKCGLKALQYMALGIPPVVSPVGANAEIVQHGVNGFHARTEDDWVERILELLASPELRRRLGEAARHTVEARYAARIQAPVLASVLERAVR